MVRPQIVSYFFIASYLSILSRYTIKKDKLIWLLPFLQIIWVNIHLLSFLGLGLIFIFIIGELLSWKVKLPLEWNKRADITAKDWSRLLYVGIFSLIAVCVNPYGVRIFSMGYQMLIFLGEHADLMVGGISELIPPLSFTIESILSLDWFYYKLLVLCVTITVLLNIKRHKLSYLLLFVVFLMLSMKANRATAWFALISIPIVSDNIASMLPSIRKFLQRNLRLLTISNYLKGATLLSGVFVISFYFWDVLSSTYYVNGKIVKDFGFGVSEFYPRGAIEFIKENNIKGNVFNTFGFGHYFTYHLYPEHRVFIDGRTHVYGENLLRLYSNAFVYPATFDILVREFDINYFFLRLRDSALLDRLHRDQDWKLVYFDFFSLIFIKDAPVNRNIIDKYEVKLEGYKEKAKFVDKPSIFTPLEGSILRPISNLLTGLRRRPFPYSFLHKGLLFNALGLHNEAEHAFRQAIIINPEVGIIYHSLANVYKQKGEIDKAILYYKKAIEINPRLRMSYNNLGYLYAQKGYTKKAYQLYKKALSFGGVGPPEAHNNLAGMYFSKGLFRKALDHSEVAVRMAPHRPEFHFNLGNIYDVLGRRSEAMEAFEEAIRLRPEYAESYNNLAAIYIDLGALDKAESLLRRALIFRPDLEQAKRALKMIEGMRRH